MMTGKEMAHEIYSRNHVAIRRGLTLDGYYILNDSDFKECVDSARAEYLGIRDGLEMHPQTSRLDRTSLDESPWRKLAIGATNGVGEPYAQFLTTTYFSSGNAGLPGLQKLFEVLVGLRNLLAELPPGHDFSGTWDACRIHHYPKGGGFMSKHRDTHFPKVLGLTEMPFLQVSACMSRRGVDFETGGGFLLDKRGSRVDLEAYGAIIIFDGTQHHGVDCVDLDSLPDLYAATGRMAAFTNIYEIL